MSFICWFRMVALCEFYYLFSILLWRAEHQGVVSACVAGFSLFLGLVVLGLTAHWTQGSLLDFQLWDFEIVGFLAGALTALVLPMLYVPLSCRAFREK